MNIFKTKKQKRKELYKNILFYIILSITFPVFIYGFLTTDYWTIYILSVIGFWISLFDFILLTIQIWKKM